MSHKIMVVEDDQPILELMEILLTRIGYEPLIVPDVIEALEIVKKDPPALILLDIMMEPMDGWEFLEKIRKEYGMKDLPVILFTASAAVEERLKTMHDSVILKNRSPLPISRTGSRSSSGNNSLKFFKRIHRYLLFIDRSGEDDCPFPVHSLVVPEHGNKVLHEMVMGPADEPGIVLFRCGNNLHQHGLPGKELPVFISDLADPEEELPVFYERPVIR
jgi:CheY-like chemotaxis protein